MTSPIIYSAFMGTIIGAFVDECGALMSLVYNVYSANTTGSTSAAMGSAFGVFHLIYGPFIGAMIGMLGGVFGGAIQPKERANNITE